MSFFNQKPAEKDDSWKDALAYISKDTRTFMKTDDVAKELAPLLRDKALAIMDAVKENGLLTEGKNKDGEAFTEKMQVKVERACKYVPLPDPKDPSKQLIDPKTNKPMTYAEPQNRDDGSPLYNARIELSHAGTKLSIHASQFPKEVEGEDGKKTKEAVLTKMSATRWNKAENKAEYVKNDDIMDSKLVPDELKKIVSLVRDGGYMTNREHSALSDMAYKMNTEVFATAEKVMATVRVYDDNKQPVLNADGTNKTEDKLVQNCFAKVSRDDFGERIRIGNHVEKNVLIELGYTKDEKPYVRAANLDFNDKAEPRQQNEKALAFFVNTEKDAAAYIPEIPELQKVVCDFKGFDIEKVQDELLNLKAEASKEAEQEVETLTEADLDGFEEILSDEDIPF